MFGLDIETLGTSEQSVVLSIAITHFDITEKASYQKLLDNTCFVKFDVKEQKEKGRLIDHDTVEWWKKQADLVKKKSLLPSKDDVSVVDGIKILKDFIKSYDEEETYVFIRGNLDNFVVDNLCKLYNLPVLFGYWCYLDFRTAILMTKESSNKSGYCDFEGQENELHLIYKHNPVDDCIFDILMLTKGY